MVTTLIVLVLLGILPVLPSATAAADGPEVGSEYEPTEPCLAVAFREITYFRGRHVLMSSDPTIRSRNGIPGPFDPSVWPYDPQGGGGHKTRSRGTQFRIYGFAAHQHMTMIPDLQVSGVQYAVQYDDETNGFYIDLGGPAEVGICVSQLQIALVDHSSPTAPGVLPGTTVLGAANKNVPGIMLARNAARIRIPERVLDELHALGLPLRDAAGQDLDSGIVDYVAIQLWGHGNAQFREFVDVEVRLLYDHPTDRHAHYRFGLHTVKNVNYESFVGCNYIDHAPGNDGVRMNDVWAGTHAGARGWGPPCGRAEPSVNERVRENYRVPFNAVQLLSTVNTHNDTIRVFVGAIRPPHGLGVPD